MRKGKKLPAVKPEYVTRDMLVDLRDELEAFCEETRDTINQAEKVLFRRDRILDEFNKVLEYVRAARAGALVLFPRLDRAHQRTVGQAREVRKA